VKTLAQRLSPALPLLAALAACGPQEIVTTNTGNVIPGEAEGNMVITNDEPANMTAGRVMDANEAAAMNMTDANASNAM
jgi:hypothetical protein